MKYTADDKNECPIGAFRIIEGSNQYIAIFIEIDEIATDAKEAYLRNKIKTTELKALSKVINEGHLIAIDDKVIIPAIIFRQQKSMSIGHSTVAATAVSENLTLATANTKNFQHIKKHQIDKSFRPLTVF